MMFQEKVAIVTGGASGIGFAVAKRFTQQNAHVIVADINLDAATQAVTKLQSIATSDDSVIALSVDVSSITSVNALLTQIKQRYGKLDYLINCAGIDNPTPLSELEEVGYDRVMDVDLKGVYLLSRAASPLLSSTVGSAIVNISSIMAWYTHPNYVAYTAAKAGVIGMTKSLATALGPEVRVNAVCPGFIDTAIWQRNLDAMEPAAATEYAERIRKLHPIGRRGKPEDVAAAVAFLCSNDAAFITGTSLIVDGGVTTKLLNETA